MDLRKLLIRWSNQQESALSQMTQRSTAAQRLGAFSKSERIDAKLFLLALAPFLPVMFSDQLGWSRGLLWHVWFWLSAIWAVAIVVTGLVAYFRAIRRSLSRKR